MFSRLWYRFCFNYLNSPILMPIAINMIIAGIVDAFTDGPLLNTFILSVAIMVATLFTLDKLIKDSIKKLILDNPDVPPAEVVRKATQKDPET